MALRILLLILIALTSIPGVVASETDAKEMPAANLLEKEVLSRDEKAELMSKAMSEYVSTMSADEAIALIRGRSDTSSKLLVAWEFEGNADLDHNIRLEFLGCIFNNRKAYDPSTALMVFNRACNMYPYDYIQVSLLDSMNEHGWQIDENEFSKLRNLKQGPAAQDN